MHSRIRAWLGHVRATWFPQREVYVRCNGVVRYWVVSRRLQWTAATAAAMLGLWLAGTTATLLVGWALDDGDQRVARVVDAAQRQIATQTAALRHEADELTRQRDSARDKLSAATATIADLRLDAERLRETHARLARERQQAVAEAESLRGKLGLVNRALAAAKRERDAIDAARAEAEANVRLADAKLAEVRRQARDDVAAAAAATETAMQRANATLAKARQQARAELTTLRAQDEAALRQARQTLAARDATVAELRQQLRQTGTRYRQALTQQRDAAAAARDRAGQAADTAAASLDAQRQAEARVKQAEAVADAAAGRQHDAERRAAIAEAERALAQRQVARIDTALATLNDRLRGDLDQTGPKLVRAVAAAFEGDLAAMLVRRSVAADDSLRQKFAPSAKARARLPEANRRLVAAIVDDRPAKGERARMLAALSAMKADAPAARSDAEGLLAQAQSLAERLAAERRAADRRAGAYAARIAKLERRLDDLNELQATLVGELETRTSATVVGLEDTVNATGLNPDELLRRMGKENGVGGPLVVLAPQHGGHVVEALGPRRRFDLNSTLDRLYGRLARWKALTLALERVPLTPPVDNFYISSGFGKRRDPFTGRWAVHEGIDMAGPRNAEVYATAPGTVTVAGWHGAYGRMVEIDHGFGLTTRYGHLRRILVKKGDTVAFRDRIGIMGSTGRSTSRHVHYEVRFDDEPVDPAKFIEAGRHVFKN